ncbi:MAG: diguanylate cyclase [Gemmatimonadota bacterium]
MDIGSFLSLIPTAALLLAAVAGIAGAYHYRLQLSKKDSDRDERERQTALAPPKTSKAADTDLLRKSEFAEEIPLIISKAAQKLPKGSFPPLAVRFAKRFFRARQVGYFVPIEGSSDYTLEVGVGFSPGWEGNVRIASDEGMVGVAIRRKVVAARCDAFSSSGRRSAYPSLENSGVEPDFVAPVIGLSGVIGVLVIAGCPFPPDRERIYVSALSDLLSTALQNAALAELSKSGSWFDPLTGVANRLYFAQRFESEIRHAQNYRKTLALFMLDIDHFKTINDTFGHFAGDQAIRKFAEMIRGVTRSSDIVCRFGGDEFAVLLTSANEDEVSTYSEHLREKIAATDIRLPRHDAPIRLTASGGVAIYPANGRSTIDLLNAADDALYEAKRQGRNRMIFARSTALDGSVLDAGGARHGTTAPKKSAWATDDETTALFAPPAPGGAASGIGERPAGSGGEAAFDHAACPREERG